MSSLTVLWRSQFIILCTTTITLFLAYSERGGRDSIRSQSSLRVGMLDINMRQPVTTLPNPTYFSCIRTLILISQPKKQTAKKSFDERAVGRRKNYAGPRSWLSRWRSGDTGNAGPRLKNAGSEFVGPDARTVKCGNGRCGTGKRRYEYIFAWL